MAKILILYASVEGHTARIAARIAQCLRDLEHAVDSACIAPTRAELDFAGIDAMIVGASVHYGRHPAHVLALVRKYRAALAHRRSAFYSVSLSARSKPPAAHRYVQVFLRQAGWQPQQAATFAGALPYSRYAFWKRLLMKAFVGLAGGDTDASRDYDYTDWHAVDRFAEDFARSLSRGGLLHGADRVS
jgi:menaquinone-dependent protoporphyrinogen oxidase